MGKTPTNQAARKPTVKKSFSLSDFKKKTNSENISNKPLRWLKCSKAFKDQTGMDGFPMGYVSLTRGFSNTGKSTSLSEAIVGAQKQGVLSIIIDTENNLSLSRLEKMGFDLGDEENEGFYIYVDNDFLLQNFGKNHDKSRNEASIEDMAECIHHFLDLQDAGELPFDLLFAVDSFGTLDCIKTINAHEKNTNDNNMWNAGAFEKSFKYLVNSRIPRSRKIDKPYTNTMIGVQKIWIDSMQGAGVIKHKGGEALFYGARLIFHHGGIQSHGTKKIAATFGGRDVSYGVETKIRVEKNQIDGDLGGISFEGKVISTPHGFIGIESADKEAYKKEHIKFFRDVLKEENLTADDIKNKYIVDEETDFNHDDLEDKVNSLKKGNQELMDDFENEKDN
jgi:hypothetical protein